MPLTTIKTLQQQERFTEAIALSEQQLSIQELPALRALLGILYAQNQQVEQAQGCLTQLNQITEPLSVEVLTDIAAIHLLLGQPQPALAKLNEVLARQPLFMLAQVRRGLVLMQLANYRAAMADMESGLAALPCEYHNALHNNLARCYLHLVDIDRALVHVNAAAKHGGDNKEAWVLLAVDVHIAANDWAVAEAVIEQALHNGLHETRCLRLLAVVLAAQNKHEQAKHQLRKALAKQPDNVELLEQLADVASVRGHYGEASHALHQALKVQPDNAALWTQLARLSKHTADETLPQRAAKRALALTEGKTDSDRAAALVAMANVKNDVGDLDAAQEYYQQALALLSDYVPAHLGLGHLL